MQQKTRDRRNGRSIFRALFVPLILILSLQAGVFYFAAVYGGIEDSLNQNAVDILSERVNNRKTELETRFNNRWTELDSCIEDFGSRYEEFESDYGAGALGSDPKLQILFLRECADQLIDTLRHNEVNGVYLILNDGKGVASQETEYYGLCIRDMDQESNYSGRGDLLLERSPSTLVDALGCTLDSWWEAKYAFASREAGDFFYEPIRAALEHPGADSDSLAYFSPGYRLSDSDPIMVSYSVPLLDENGYPYAVLGVELSVRYLGTLLPMGELSGADVSCYILGMRDETGVTPIAGTGALYSRCFSGERIAMAQSHMGGFETEGKTGASLYGVASRLDIYDNNSPFEERELVLLGIVEQSTLFGYIGQIKLTLGVVTLVSLLMGLMGLALASRRFARPITRLANRLRGMKTGTDFQLDRLGITEIDQLVEAIEELNRNVSRTSARTEFFSRMSHDMRTPMNAIIGFSSPELLEGATEQLKDDYLDKIHSAGGYLLGLINEVLDMTRIENNRTDLRREDVRVSALFDTTISMIDALAKNKSVRFETDVSTPDIRVSVDAGHFDQIVMNLLSNAVKFTPEGGTVRLEARVVREGEDPNQLLCRVVVSDTGIGMSPEFMQKLYTPFEQEHKGLEGTGLGLSIAKKLAELMGGSLECESKLNAGTTFRMEIPMEARPEASKTEKNSRRAADIGALRGVHVLVCEDSPINTRIVLRLLERVGITAETAVNGKAGVEAFAASAPGEIQAILMDIRMPVMDGLTACRAIRNMEREDAKAIPIIAMTADAFREDMEVSRDAGMNAHLAKPVEPQKLYDTLVSFLSSDR